MSTFTEKQAERKARKARELRECDREDAIAEMIPAAIREQIEFVHLHGRGPVVTFTVETLADALPILEAFEPAKYFYLTGGTFGHVNPRQYIKAADRESAKEETEFCAPYIEAASGGGWSECKIKMFTILDGFKMAKISIAIEKPGADWVPRMRRNINPATGREVRGVGECKLVTWSAGGEDAARATRHFTDLVMWQQFAERETAAKDAA